MAARQFHIVWCRLREARSPQSPDDKTVYDAPEWHDVWAKAAVDGQPFMNQLELLPDNLPLVEQLAV